MLTIEKHPRIFKAVAAGTIAFAVGLTGVATYFERSLQHENLAFSKEQNTTPQVLGTSANSSDPATNAGQNTSSSPTTVSPQVASGSFVPAPVDTQSASSVSTAPVASYPSTTSVTPGMGGGSGSTDASTPTGSSADTSGGATGGSTGVVDGVLQVVDGLLQPLSPLP